MLSSERRDRGPDVRHIGAVPAQEHDQQRCAVVEEIGQRHCPPGDDVRESEIGWRRCPGAASWTSRPSRPAHEPRRRIACRDRGDGWKGGDERGNARGVHRVAPRTAPQPGARAARGDPEDGAGPRPLHPVRDARVRDVPISLRLGTRGGLVPDRARQQQGHDLPPRPGGRRERPPRRGVQGPAAEGRHREELRPVQAARRRGHRACSRSSSGRVRRRTPPGAIEG